MNADKHRLFFWLILIIGVGLRLYHVWTAPYTYANSDTCTIWLSAKHILNGEFPLFFTGDYYGGPLEALTTAFFFMIFGVKDSTLYLGTIFTSGLFIISSYFLGRELKDKTAGLLIMLYCALPPVYFFWTSIVPYCYIIEILFLGNIIFILTLQNPKKIIHYILLGICAGIGVWTHYIILYYLAPAVIYLLLNEKWKNLIKHSLPAVISFFLIALPFWIFTFRYNFITFKFPPNPNSAGFDIGYFKLLIDYILRIFNLDFSPILLIYILAVLYFILATILKKGFIFNKKSILIYLLIFIIIFYIGYRSNVVTVESYYYIIPVLIFMSTALGLFVSYIINKIRIAGVFLFAFIIFYNVNGIKNYITASKDKSVKNQDAIFNRIRFLSDNKIYRFLGHEGYNKVPVFFSREKIIVTSYLEYEYTPHLDIVEASDRAAFEETPGNWKPSLDNICIDYKHNGGLFYNFKPHSYKTRMIKPSAHNAVNIRYAYDRNYDTFWINKGGKDFVMDLGKSYKICKIEIYNGHRHSSYPNSCIVETSRDGKDWIEAGRIKEVQPLFWSGPRPYWRLMDGRVEWYLKPVEARYIRLIQGRIDKKQPWQINEIFFYEYMGNEAQKIRDYNKDAKEIKNFLLKKRINFVYADFWLSAKIRGVSGGKIDTLVPYNSYLPLRKNMSREIILGKDRAFIVRKGDEDGLEPLLREFQLPYKRIKFRKYICYYSPDLREEHKTVKSLMWTGIGIARHSLKEYSDWLYKHGYYKKALEYYPNNFMAYLKSPVLPSTRFFPKVEKPIKFINGIDFLGYSIRVKNPKQGKRVRIEYFWGLKEELIGSDLSVFVHFMDNGRITFQNDHEFLYQFPRPLRPLDRERFREALKLDIPFDLKPGVYKIVIGLWDRHKQKRVAIVNQDGKKTYKQVIGELSV